jgi:hypothetical protein
MFDMAMVLLILHVAPNSRHSRERGNPDFLQVRWLTFRGIAVVNDCFARKIEYLTR